MNDSNVHNAEQALSSVGKYSTAGMHRGMYTRAYAVTLAIWIGAMIASFTQESALWIPLFVGGLVAHHFWRRGQGAWVNEVRSHRDIWIVLALTVVLLGVAVGGILGYRHGYGWAPYVAGATISITLYCVMEIAYGPVWAAMKAAKKDAP